MYAFFPQSYIWSAQFAMGLWAGGQFGEMHRWLSPFQKVKELDE
jgi:hypothetical protein